MRLAIVVMFFTAAPTAGDIGSCGQSPDDLDPAKFFAAKNSVDCVQCHRCHLTTQACTLACSVKSPTTDFPVNCIPLVHDGEVCLHVLQIASCNQYAGYMSDDGAVIPTECNFCPPCDDGGLPPDSAPLPKCE